MKIIHCDVENRSRASVRSITRGAVPVGLGCEGVRVLCAVCVRRHADLTE